MIILASEPRPTARQAFDGTRRTASSWGKTLPLGVGRLLLPEPMPGTVRFILSLRPLLRASVAHILNLASGACSSWQARSHATFPGAAHGLLRPSSRIADREKVRALLAHDQHRRNELPPCVPALAFCPYSSRLILIGMRIMAGRSGNEARGVDCGQAASVSWGSRQCATDIVHPAPLVGAQRVRPSHRRA